MTDYTTLSAVKSYLRIGGTADDVLLAALVTRASRLIDGYCHRWFAAETQTRTYDAVGPHLVGRLLLLDADLLTVTTIINGDGSPISLSEVILRPHNWPPYFGIALKATSPVIWTYTGSPEDAISITGTWGYSAVPPEPVVQAAVRLTAWLYRQRDTGAEPGQIEVTERGVPVAPARLPRDVYELLGPYVRIRLSAVA